MIHLTIREYIVHLNKATNSLGIAGALVMQAQVLPLIWDSWVNGQQIPLLTTALVFLGLTLISLRYLKDSFILTLNCVNIGLHLLVQLPRIF